MTTRRLYQYSVSPFSRIPHHLLSSTDESETCAICGHAVSGPVLYEACVIDGGTAWGDDAADETDPGYMGVFPIGSDCHRRFAIR